MHIRDAKPGSELGEERREIRSRRADRTGWGQWGRLAPMLAGAEIGAEQDMKRRMLDPVRGELFEIEERHLVDYRVAVAAGGGEETIDASPAVCPG
jgi:hypothetical protein